MTEAAETEGAAFNETWDRAQKLKQRTPHNEVDMERVKPLAANMVYCGKSWKATFACPVCDRTVWQNLNFLGGRHLVCNGLKVTILRKETK